MAPDRLRELQDAAAWERWDGWVDSEGKPIPEEGEDMNLEAEQSCGDWANKKSLQQAEPSCGELIAALRDSRCHYLDDRVPGAFRKIDAYTDGEWLILCGAPERDDESHNCDEMGCGSLDHVLHRIQLSR